MRGRRRQYIVVAELLFLIAGAAYGAPFARTFTFAQPDGTVLTLFGRGDEFHADFETLDGYTVVFDPDQRAYFYASLAVGGAELKPIGLPVGQGDPASLNLARHLRITPESRSAKTRERQKRWAADMGIDRRWAARKAAMHAPTGASSGGVGTSVQAPPAYTTTGAKVGLCLLIDFSDDPANIPQASIADFCNGTNYTAYGNNGSVMTYFRDVSNGLLTYTNVVTIYIRAPKLKSFYNNTHKDCGLEGRALIGDALDAMKALPNYSAEILPRFSSLTVDGSGLVAACNVFFAGANSGVWSYGLWPHSWVLASPVDLGNGKSVYYYQISDIGASLSINTFCHENGHMLCDYPDLYDYGYDSIGGAGDFCLMGYGGSETNPVQICAYLKRASGWASTVELTSASNLVASSSSYGADFNKFYRYQKPGVSTEYYLIENRQKRWHDGSLPASGIALWHVDELGDRDNQSTNYNSSHLNYELSLVQADNLFDFQKNANYGDSKDLYYFGNTAAGYSNRFADATAPSARWWDGSNSGLNVRDFSASGTTMVFTVGSPVIQLAIELPATVTERAGVLTNAGRVIINAPAATNVTVSLTSGVPVTVSVPASVTVLALQTTVVFNVTVGRDGIVGPTQSVAVVAHVAGWTDGTGTVTVLDNEPMNLSLNLPASTREGSGVLTNAGRAGMAARRLDDLELSVASSDPWELTAPATVKIPAGSTSVYFNVTAGDDVLTDGARTVTVTVAAAGYTNGVASMVVEDNDAHHFTFGAIATQQAVGISFAIAVTARDVNNVAIPVFTNTVGLSASGDHGPVGIVPASAGPFAVGQWIGLVTISTADTGIRMAASDGFGHSGTSTAFTAIIVPDYFTECFTGNDNDTASNTWTFVRDVSVSRYSVTRAPASAFPTDPAGGTTLALSDDDSLQVSLSSGASVVLYGTNYTKVYVNANGNLTFASASSSYLETITNHFNAPRISILFDDLRPALGGTISWKQLTNLVAVTFLNVKEQGGLSTNSFQFELFFDGRIRLTTLGIGAKDGLIGLSAGGGVPPFFFESDFSAYPLLTADGDGDGMPDAWEISYFGGTNAVDGGATDDWDKDWMDNRSEWMAGTDPTNSLSLLHVLPGSTFSGTNLVLQWSSVSGKYYAIERGTNLMGGLSFNVASNIFATPDVNVRTVTVDGAIQEFFRIRLEP